MKFALVIPDGVADEPQAALQGLTPLQAAQVPHMDQIATQGVLGLTSNVPQSMTPGSDVGTMSLFGYDPLECHTGRAPLEAAAQGIALDSEDWAVRCNLVTMRDEMMLSFTADQVSSAAAAELLQLVERDLPAETPWEIHAGVSYRNLAIYRARDGLSPFDGSTVTVPPHDLTDQRVQRPTGAGAEQLNQLMRRSESIFAAHRDVQSGIADGRRPATGIWLWGQGQSPTLESFRDRFGLQASVITAVDLLRGLGKLLGWTVVDVPGATGYLDTDYRAKARYAINALRDVDLVVVHVEATDEASHEGDVQAKLKAVECIDRDIVRPLHAHLKSQGPYRLLVCPDHPTYLRTKTHSHGFCPFAMCGSGLGHDARGPGPPSVSYDEVAAAASSVRLLRGHELMGRFVTAQF
jgi:2,3-bisphosphoglycerate-independent phosphoglycerate mutase